MLGCYSAYALKYPERNKDYIKRAIKKILACRTEANGCRVYKCPDHPVFLIVPHSCGSRFCTTCSSFKTAIWVEEKVALLASISTPYCFLTFTVHGAISAIIQENKELLLKEVFHAVSHSLLYWCREQRNFTPGIVMIMQTSGDRLNYHVHIHLLITCGGLRGEKKWVVLNPRKRDKSGNGKKYHPAFPPQPIIKGFKTLLYRALRRAYQTKEFKLPLEYASRASNPAGFNRLLRAWWEIDWNVDISDPLNNAGEILRYIARYIKKPPISDRRIREYGCNIVKFTAKDRKSRDRRQKEIITMTTDYFLSSFLEHVPLEHFPLIRWYGIFSNRSKGKLMPIVQKLIPPSDPVEVPAIKEKGIDLWRRMYKEKFDIDPLVCPICGKELKLIAVFFPGQLPPMNTSSSTKLTTSFEDIPQLLIN